MSSREEVTLPATSKPKSRKSLAQMTLSHAMDQENMTADIGALTGAKRALPVEKAAKKSRSKSIGPGGLDTLKDSSGNRRKSLASIIPPRSILKPTLPPLREIPAHKGAIVGSPKKTTPPSSAKESNTLIDFNLDIVRPTVTGTESLPNPFQVEGSAAVNETRVTLRTEEEQQAAAREREAVERQELDQDDKARRDARRNRLQIDSTMSSNSTISTRRASSASGGSVGSPHPRSAGAASSDPSEPPSTPPEQEEDVIRASPAHQRDLHQKKRRRSSGIPPMNFNNPDDELFSSSPCSGSSVGDADEIMEDEDASNSNSDVDDDDDDGTMMSIDNGDGTDMSLASVKSAPSDSSARLEEALRSAARQAGTHGIDFGEHGEKEVVGENDGVIASFAPWTKKSALQDLESQQDQENVNPFSSAAKSGGQQQEDEQSDGGEITMDMTHAVGGILPGQQPDEDELSMDVTRALGGIIANESDNANTRRKSMSSTRRQSTRRRSSGQSSTLDDETMDLTMAIGGIKSTLDDTVSNDEDMTMEFTAVIGGMLPQGNATTRNRRRSSLAAKGKLPSKRKRESLESTRDDDTMDMTIAIGGIMPLVDESATGELEETVGMDMTTALGSILPPQLSTGNRSQMKALMQAEADPGSSPFRTEVLANSPPKVSAPAHIVTMASETGSPSLAAFRGKGLRRSAEARNSTTPKSSLSNGTPVKRPVTPSKQLTPQPARPTTPGKTPPSKNVTMRTSSPKRLFRHEIKSASSTPQASASKKGLTPNKLFQKDKNTGAATPSFILTPQRRLSSGIGFDQVGLGSPRVAALLDRRGSIGDHARLFVPSQVDDTGRAVSFDDPRAIEAEIDKELEQEEDLAQLHLEHEADQGDEKDATVNLKKMIQSLTPKKKPLKGRKSLHVGAARGILGKRPVELDEDEDEEDDGSKRLKGYQGSPVKNVKLKAPPSKAETTTGRLTRAARKSIEDATNSTVTLTIPSSPAKARSMATHALEQNRDGPVVENEPVDESNTNEESDDRIQLQDFLNMTNIRFMELTTTKRRHTTAPKFVADDLSRDRKAEDAKLSLEDCVVAGAATIPMLELFQHACHELKSYISEGRSTVREIEAETFEENPPLFREYISASSDVKIVMDNQLKNVKTHARLLGKGMWYEWRTTLLATLKDGLLKTVEGMAIDGETLNQQAALIDSVLPSLSQRAKQLETEEADLQLAAEELATCDPEQLSDARQQLIKVESDIESKKQLIFQLRKQLEGKEAEIEAGTQRKEACLQGILEAEKIREECRGWTSSEINTLKAKVDVIEKEHGWTITGVSGATTSMTYRKEIELVFEVSSFLSNTSNSAARQAKNSRIDLWYIAANRELNPLPLTTDKEFFLQSIRDHIRGLEQSQTHVKNLLHAVSSAWNKARSVADDIHLLNLNCPTAVAKTSDNSIVVQSTLLIAPLATKVELSLQLTSHSGETGIDVEVSPSAEVVYGERFNQPKMREFLLNRMGDTVEEKGRGTKVSWASAIGELGQKLLARGRK